MTLDFLIKWFSWSGGFAVADDECPIASALPTGLLPGQIKLVGDGQAYPFIGHVTFAASGLRAFCIRPAVVQPSSLPSPSVPCSSAPFGRADARGVIASS